MNLDKDAIRNLESYVSATSVTGDKGGLFSRLVIRKTENGILTTNKDGINKKDLKEPQPFLNRIVKETIIRGNYLSPSSYYSKLESYSKKHGVGIEEKDLVKKKMTGRSPVDGFKMLMVKDSTKDTEDEVLYLKSYVDKAKTEVYWYLDGEEISFEDLKQTLGKNLKQSAFKKYEDKQQTMIGIPEEEQLRVITTTTTNVEELKVGDFMFSKRN